MFMIFEVHVFYFEARVVVEKTCLYRDSCFTLLYFHRQKNSITYENKQYFDCSMLSGNLGLIQNFGLPNSTQCGAKLTTI